MIWILSWMQNLLQLVHEQQRNALLSAAQLLLVREPQKLESPSWKVSSVVKEVVMMTFLDDLRSCRSTRTSHFQEARLQVATT